MQSTMINSVLKNIVNVDLRVLNDELRKVETYSDVGYTIMHTHYFFLKRELGVTASGWNDAKKEGLIRHAKIYAGKFLDYVVHKEFNTIEEWVKDAGGKMEDVLYGENRVRANRRRYDYNTRQIVEIPYTPQYVELKDLLKALGYEEPPQVEVPADDEVDFIELLTKEVEKRGANITDVYVLNGGSFWSLKTFLGK